MLVADVERSRQFYEALGGTHLRTDPGDGACYLNLGGVELCLHPGGGPLLKLGIEVDDADLVLQRLADARLTTGPQPTDHRHLVDPDGYEFDLRTKSSA